MTNTNVKGPFPLTAPLAPPMVERRGGIVVNITTMAAHVGLAGGAVYGASKAALSLLMKSWRSAAFAQLHPAP
jgi:NAD(P)-dependent dehydrogenase (short-subunit alcohol dehydrogenase family)